MAYAGKYITSADLIAALTKETFIAIFDDQNSGSTTLVNDASVQLVIDGAEGEVDSYFITVRPQPLPTTTAPTVDRMVKRACLELAMSLSWERHPEYVRTYGENPRATALRERAERTLERIKEGRQELPDVDKQNGKPVNIGGVVIDDGPRTAITSPDGTENGAGF